MCTFVVDVSFTSVMSAEDSIKGDNARREASGLRYLMVVMGTSDAMVSV